VLLSFKLVVTPLAQVRWKVKEDGERGSRVDYTLLQAGYW
jgi:hypothetical protein